MRRCALPTCFPQTLKGWQRRESQSSSLNTENPRTIQSGAIDRHMQALYPAQDCPQTYGKDRQKVLGNDVVQDMAMHIR